MRAVVLGGGYAGVVVTVRLERQLPEDDEIVLVDQRGTHLVRHELHRVIHRPEFAGPIQIPLSDIVSRAMVLERTVESLDADDRVVHFDDGDSLDYDSAVVCLGTTPDYHGLDGVERNSVSIRTPQEARVIGQRGESILRAGGNVVIGGGGLTGVQVAGELAEMNATTDGDGSVTIIEQTATVAPTFDPGFQAAIASALDDAGVTVKTGRAVEAAEPDRVFVEDDEPVPADLFVWAGGLKGVSPFDGERPMVRSDLRLAERTFVAGDAARVVDVNGAATTPSAQTAVRQANVAANNVAATLEAARDGSAFDPELGRYRFDPFAWVVSVGDDAVAQVGPQVLRGRAAKTIKSTVGIGYLSSAGAIREVVELMRMEFGFSNPSTES